MPSIQLPLPFYLPEDPQNNPEISNGPITLHYELFTNVQNALDLKTKIIEATIPECLMVDAALIATPQQLILSAFKAYTSFQQNTMKSKTLYVELLFHLHPGNNISEAIKCFGLTESTKSLWLLYFSTPTTNQTELQSNHEILQKEIKGQNVILLQNDNESSGGASISEHEYETTIVDWKRIMKTMKMLDIGIESGGNVKQKKSGRGGSGGVSAESILATMDKEELKLIVLGSMGVKGVN